MRKQSLRWTSIVVALLAAPYAIAEEPLPIDRANARILFNEALDLRAVGDHDGALKKLRAAEAILSTPRIRLELAREELAIGEVVAAYEMLLSIESMKGEGAADAKYAATRKEAATLADAARARVSTIHVKVDRPPTADMVLFIDGTKIAAGDWESPHLVDPGPHIVRISGDRVTLDRRVSLGEGEEGAITLLLPAPSTTTTGGPSAVPAAPKPASDKRRPLAMTAWILGGVTAGIGTAMIVAGKHDDQDRRTASTVGPYVLLGGGVVFVAGSLLWLTTAGANEASSSAHVSLGVSPTGVSFGGSF